MKAIFVADAHLRHSSDAEYEKCIRFFSSLRANRAGSSHLRSDSNIETDLLVIAGDFFDFWFEKKGRIYPEFIPVVKSIVQIKESGIKVVICEGNHDFFLSDFFSKQLGIDVYPGYAELELDGLRVFISHGDTIDGKNRQYLALRRFLRSAFIYKLQKAIPLCVLWQIAKISSSMSARANGDVRRQIMDAMNRYAAEKFQEGYDAVILGHCHEPHIKEEKIGGRNRIQIHLGDWMSRSSYLIFEGGRFTLNSFPRE